MKILLLCQYFAPEPGAPQARWLEMGSEWVRLGHRLTAVTAFPNHPTGVLRREDRGRLFAREEMEGIDVFRSYIYATPNRGFGRRTLGHLSFMLTSAFVGGARARRPDVVVVSSPTFFSVPAAWFLSRRFGVPLVFEVRDLWPAVFKDLGVLRSPLLLRILTGAEMALYRASALVVTVTEGFRRDIVARGLPPERVVTITNGVDTLKYAPGGDRAEARRRLGLPGGFLALYLGAHGISHALTRILEVAERWRGIEDAHFVFVGEGSEKQRLINAAAAQGMRNVLFRPAVPKEAVADYYRAADAAFVPLRDVPLFRTFIPSKMFEVLACGVPVLGSVAGEAAEILSASGGSVVVPPEDVPAMDAALRRLRAEAGFAHRLGESGARFVRERYDRRALARRYLSALEGVVAAGGGSR